MTASACLQREGAPAVTSPAGFAFFHLGHCYGTLPFAPVYLFMTDEAVIFNRRSVQMFIMAEYRGSRIADRKGYIDDIRCKNLGVNHHGSGQRDGKTHETHELFLKGNQRETKGKL